MITPELILGATIVLMVEVFVTLGGWSAGTDVVGIELYCKEEVWGIDALLKGLFCIF